jgi:microcystin-dependent protein
MGGYTTYKGAYLPVVSGDVGVWGTDLNNSTFPVFDANLGGYASVSISNANITLSTGQDQTAILRLTGAISTNITVTTACQGFKMVENYTTGNYSVIISNGGSVSAYVPQNTPTILIADPTNGVRPASYGVPCGTLIPFCGNATAIMPGGWLFAAGQAVSRTSFVGLFNTIGTTYGTGDGSTTFNLPDLRGRSIFGLDNMGGTAAGRISLGILGNISSGTTLGSTGGEENHGLVTTEIPAHTHSVNDSGHYHSYKGSGGNYQNWFQGGSAAPGAVTTLNTDTAWTGISIANAGGSGPHNTTPPGIILNWLIKH